MAVRLSVSKRFSSDISIENVTINMLAEPIDDQKSQTMEIIISETMHNHPFCELFVCGNGILTFETEERTVVLHSGEALVIPPNFYHRVRDNSVCDKWGVVSFSCTMQPGYEKKDFYAMFQPFEDGNHPMMIYQVPILFDKLLSLHHAVDSEDSLSVTMQFASLLICAAEQYAKQFSPVNTGKYPNDAITRLNRLNVIINTGFMQNLTVQSIADRMFLSRSQLSRIVKKHYGTSLNEILTEKRITAAEHLLKTTPLPVEYISSTVGFGSISNFYREFTKKHGMSPAKYRKLF